MSHTALGPLAFWEGYEGELLTLLIYAVGLGLYAIFVGAFYITLSQRDLKPLGQGGKGPGLSGLLVILPLVSFGLFLVLTVAFFFLAKVIGPPEPVPEPQRVRDLLLIGMAVVMGVRVTAYVSEHAAVDLAKLVPLGLLGVFLVDPGYQTLETPLSRLGILAGMLDHVARYFVLIIVLELVLRGLWILTGGPARARAKAQQASAPAPQHR